MRLIDETEYQKLLAKIPMEERTFRRAVEAAEDMPTIDAVPVVRCADCLFRNDYADSEENAHMYCTRCDCCLDVDPTDFCSYGERKDGE